jgi:hypothetical protein
MLQGAKSDRLLAAHEGDTQYEIVVVQAGDGR